MSHLGILDDMDHEAKSTSATAPLDEFLKRNEQAWLIVHDLIEMAREDLRLKVKDAPDELVNALNMALYAIRSRPHRS